MNLLIPLFELFKALLAGKFTGSTTIHWSQGAPRMIDKHEKIALTTWRHDNEKTTFHRGYHGGGTSSSPDLLDCYGAGGYGAVFKYHAGEDRGRGESRYLCPHG